MGHCVRGSLLLLALVLSAAAQTTWPPADSAITANVNAAATNYVQAALHGVSRPQFSWYSMLNGENIVGDNGVAYMTTNNQLTGVNVVNGHTKLSTQVNGNFYGPINMSPNGVSVCAGQAVTTISATGTVNVFPNTACLDEVLPSYDGTMLYYVNPNPQSLNAINSATGALVWSTPMHISFLEGTVQDAQNNLYLGPIAIGTEIYNATYYYLKVCGKTGDILTMVELPFDMTMGNNNLMLSVQYSMLFVSNASMIVAMDLDYNVKWSFTNPNYNYSEPTYANSPALNEGSSTLVYFPSQGVMYALPYSDGVLDWQIAFPNCKGYLTVLVTPNDQLFVTDGCGGLHGVSDLAETWSMSINDTRGAVQDGYVIGIGGELIFAESQQFAVGLGYAVITSTGHAVIGGDNYVGVTLSAYPILGNALDADFVSVTCQLLGDSGVVGILDAELITGSTAGVTCFPPTTTITGAINSIAIIYYYADGTYYTTPTFQLSVISATDVTPTSGPWEGGNVLTISGTGFDICSEINVTCEFVFYQMVGQPVTPTVVSNTEMTVVVPHSPTGGGIQPTLTYIQVTINGTTFQSGYITYTWGGTGNLGLLEACPPCFYAAVIGGPVVGICLCVGALCICARMRRSKQRKADETINLLRSDQGPPPAYSTKA